MLRIGYWVPHVELKFSNKTKKKMDESDPFSSNNTIEDDPFSSKATLEEDPFAAVSSDEPPTQPQHEEDPFATSNEEVKNENHVAPSAASDDADPFGSVDPSELDPFGAEECQASSTAHELPSASLSDVQAVDEATIAAAGQKVLPASTPSATHGELEAYGDFVSANLDLVSFYEMKVSPEYHKERRTSQVLEFL